MAKASKQRGRKRKPFYFAAEQRYVDGLRKRPVDGRWELSDGRMFTETDEAKAVAHFYELAGEKKYESFAPDEAAWLRAKASDIVDGNMATAVARGFMLIGETEQAWRRFWAYVSREIRTRPQWVAEQTQIEQLGYLTRLKPPEVLPTFDEMEKVWLTYSRCSKEDRKKVARAWKDLREHAEVEGLLDITPETLVDYQDEVRERIIARRDGTEGTMSGKQQSHIYGGIRRLLRFCASRAMAVDAINTALGYLDLILKPSESTVTLDPKPIEVDDWRKLLAAAEGDDKALLLLMLNGAFYIGEAIELQWEDIKDGCIVTNRKKTGKCIRVCVLWQETIDALNQIERKGNHIFYTYAGQPIKTCGAQRRWQQVALKAGLAAEREAIYGGRKKQVVKCDVTASQLRDGAYTAAVAANVNADICRLLIGHRAPGVQDNYARRQPKMVKSATDAIYATYFG